jgi:hypothetical protein
MAQDTAEDRNAMSFPDLVSWGWRETHPAHQNANNLMIHLFAVPLDDFFICVEDLTKTIEGDKQTRSCLDTNELQYVRDLRTRFREAVLDPRKERCHPLLRFLALWPKHQFGDGLPW